MAMYSLKQFRYEQYILTQVPYIRTNYYKNLINHEMKAKLTTKQVHMHRHLFLRMHLE